MNSQTEQQAPSYPWYDDRVEDLHQNLADPEEDYEDQYDTPKKIHGYLCEHVWKQDEAKRAASIILHNCLHGIKSNGIFVGPTGSGKSYLWRCLQKIYPNRIVIADSSGVSKEGWAGSVKWRDLLRSPIFRSENHSILVCDEFDKMCSPKITSGGNNASFDVQGEALTLVEGTHVDVKINSVTHSIDTSKISFVLLGAFSNKAHDIAEKSSGSRIGFGAAPEPIQPYARPLDIQDLIDFGLMPELAGRISRIVNLQPMTVEDFYRMTDNSLGFLSHIGEQYKADIRLTPAKRRELAELAARTGLGVRGMESQIRHLIDDAIFDDCKRCRFEF
ncbi:MAG: AAA domain-containing protein [Clostridiales bacterium]|nr:AAA domain-containing protein [Clostridiales bacterium]